MITICRPGGRLRAYHPVKAPKRRLCHAHPSAQIGRSARFRLGPIAGHEIHLLWSGDLGAGGGRVYIPPFGGRAQGRVRGLLHRLAQGQHCGHQVQQWPREVMVGDQEIPVVQTKMVDGGAGNRPVRHRDSHSACHELLPAPSVATASGVDHPAPHSAVRFDLRYFDRRKHSATPCPRCRAVASRRGCQGQPRAPGASPRPR